MIGCDYESTQLMVNCLKQRSAKQIVAATEGFYTHRLPIAPFGPVIETSIKSSIPTHPLLLLNKEIVNDVPWIVSTSKTEGLFPLKCKILKLLLNIFYYMILTINVFIKYI